MNKIILEYIWLDGYETQNLRSKIKHAAQRYYKDVVKGNFPGKNNPYDNPDIPHAILQFPACVYKNGFVTHLKTSCFLSFLFFF